MVQKMSDLRNDLESMKDVDSGPPRADGATGEATGLAVDAAVGALPGEGTGRLAVDAPAPRSRLPASRIRPLEFGWVAVVLVGSLVLEAIFNAASLLVYLVRRGRVREACHRAILRQRGPRSAGTPGAAAAALLVLALLSTAGAGCRSLKRDLDETAWTVQTLVDTQGDIESLRDSVGVFVEVEPIGELWWSAAAMTGVTETRKDVEELAWSLGVFLDVGSDRGALLETLEMLAY
jgi:hypothetical protein